MAKRATLDNLTVDRLKEVVSYDEITGDFTWLRKMGTRGIVGRIAGSKKKGRHTLLMIDNTLYKAHRLVFLYMTGAWPAVDVDHIDLEKSNNAWANLRESNRSQNMANTPLRSTNRSGFKGVSLHTPSGLWQAQITKNYENIHIGYFKSKEDAHRAYCEASIKLQGEFARAA
jgi:hypothetical protein